MANKTLLYYLFDDFSESTNCAPTQYHNCNINMYAFEILHEIDQVVVYKQNWNIRCVENKISYVTVQQSVVVNISKNHSKHSIRKLPKSSIDNTLIDF